MTQMSNEQFQQLLRSITEAETVPEEPLRKVGSFSKCTSRFGGERCHTTVQNFVTSINIYKEIENMKMP